MPQGEHNFTEKRDYQRMRLNSQVTLLFADEESAAICRDLSSTGMQLETACPLQIGNRVLVHIASGLSKFEDLQAEVEVLRVTPLEGANSLIGVAVIRMI